MNPQQQALAQLRDFHSPPAIGWWPPAPGWWLVAALTVGLLIWGIVTIRRRHRANAWRRQAQVELEWIKQGLSDRSETESIIILIQLMKRVIQQLEPSSKATTITDSQWQQLLKSRQFGLRDSDIDTLSTDIYRPGAGHLEPALLDRVEAWLKECR